MKSKKIRKALLIVYYLAILNKMFNILSNNYQSAYIDILLLFLYPMYNQYSYYILIKVNWKKKKKKKKNRGLQRGLHPFHLIKLNRIESIRIESNRFPFLSKRMNGSTLESLRFFSKFVREFIILYTKGTFCFRCVLFSYLLVFVRLPRI